MAIQNLRDHIGREKSRGKPGHGRLVDVLLRSVQPVSLSAETESNDALELLKADGQRVGEYLQASLTGHTHAPPKLLQAIEYSLMAGGKRLRPALVLECARACGGGETNASAMAAAGPIELIHTFSLV